MSGLKKLQEYCVFGKPNTCYILQIIARKKENSAQTEKAKLKAQARRIVVDGLGLEESYYELRDLALRMAHTSGVTYRMYVSVNRRDMIKGLRAMLNHVLDLLFSKNNETKAISRISSKWKSLLSKDSCRYDKDWMLDIDTTDPTIIGLMKLQLDSVDSTVIYRTHTPNGMAWVVTPFNPTKVIWPEEIKLCKDHLMFVELFGPK